MEEGRGKKEKAREGERGVAREWRRGNTYYLALSIN